MLAVAVAVGTLVIGGGAALASAQEGDPATTDTTTAEPSDAPAPDGVPAEGCDHGDRAGRGADTGTTDGTSGGAESGGTEVDPGQL